MKQINPTISFYQQQQNENSLIVENKLNPIHGRPCVHPGTKFKVLIACFIEINQQSDSFPLLTIILKTKNKQSNTMSCITIKYIFLLIEIRYFIQPVIDTHVDCVNNSQSVFGAFSKQQHGALKVCFAAFSVSYFQKGKFSFLFVNYPMLLFYF